MPGEFDAVVGEDVGGELGDCGQAHPFRGGVRRPEFDAGNIEERGYGEQTVH